MRDGTLTHTPPDSPCSTPHQRFSRVVKELRGQARLTDANIQDALREVRLALLEADVALPVVRDFINGIREKAIGAEVAGSLTPGQALIGVVHRELAALMGGAAAPLSFATQPPAVILLAGLQGSGKTTSAGKLARLIKNTTKKKVLMVSADVYRPAAIEQLRTLATQVGVDFFPSTADQQPVAIAEAALDWARRHYHEVLIVDTAGRLAIDEAMMKEVAALHAALKPIETLFVVDAMQGQDAVNTARAFRDALPLTGVVLTKLDGDSRGGAALSVRQVTGAPIKFAGISEKIDGLEVFHPERMASRILGMGDVLSLLEDARKNVDVAEAEKLAKKVKSGKGFDLTDFRAQIGQMRKMGGLAGMIEKLPAELARAAQSATMDERRIGRLEGIINSMTPGARQARTPQGVPQAADRRRRRGLGAGSQPAPQSVRTDAKNDEDGLQRRHAEDAAGNEGHAAGDALIPLGPVVALNT
jgi:signal recognition particle subunit SRP54